MLAIGAIAICLIIAGVVVWTRRPSGLDTPQQSFDNPLYDMDMGQRRGSSHFYSTDGGNSTHFVADKSLNGNQSPSDDTYVELYGDGTVNPLYSHDGDEDVTGFLKVDPSTRLEEAGLYDEPNWLPANAEEEDAYEPDI